MGTVIVTLSYSSNFVFVKVKIPIFTQLKLNNICKCVLKIQTRYKEIFPIQILKEKIQKAQLHK